MPAMLTTLIAFLAALAILLPLALTSTDAAVARMGTGWKRLQRWVYAAVVLTAAHWLMVTENLVMAILSFAPLAGLSLWLCLRLREGLAAGRLTSAEWKLALENQLERRDAADGGK